MLPQQLSMTGCRDMWAYSSYMYTVIDSWRWWQDRTVSRGVSSGGLGGWSTWPPQAQEYSQYLLKYISLYQQLLFPIMIFGTKIVKLHKSPASLSIATYHRVLESSKWKSESMQESNSLSPWWKWVWFLIVHTSKWLKISWRGHQKWAWSQNFLAPSYKIFTQMELCICTPT